jgi:hypothetical protein
LSKEKTHTSYIGAGFCFRLQTLGELGFSSRQQVKHNGIKMLNQEIIVLKMA